MSLAPIPRGNVGTGHLVVQSGWGIDIDDFNMDVLKFSTLSTLTDAILFCPEKYALLGASLGSTITFPSMPNQVRGIGGMSCSARKIVPGDGLSARSELEFKGFTSGQPRDPISSLSWTTQTYSVPAISLNATFNFIGPAQAQLTLKQGNIGAYDCQVGKSGNPTGSASIPNSFTLQLQTNAGIVTLAIYATQTNMLCTKHDRQEAGIYFEETQVWVKNYIQL